MTKSGYQYPLATSTWDHREYQVLEEVIASGQFTMGARVKAFEEAFAGYIGSKFAVMVNSGSSANLLMIASLFYTKDNNLRRGDEVIVPAVSWSTSYFPLYQYGLKLRFVDIDLNTLNYDLDALASSITSKTKVILAVNLLGNPNDFDRIKEIIGRKNIRLIEDNCESLGASFKDEMTGSIGLIGTFSTFFSHHISTMEGGVVVTSDEEIYHILLSLRAHGWTRELPLKNHVSGLKSHDKFLESWNFVLPGYNVRPLEMSGALGLEQLKKLPRLLAGRRENAEYLKESLKNNKKVTIQTEIGDSSWFGFSLVLADDANISRAHLVSKLEERGIEARPIVAGDFTSKIVMRYFDSDICGPMVNARRIDQNGLFIGNQHFSIKEMVDEVVAVLGAL